MANQQNHDNSNKSFDREDDDKSLDLDRHESSDTSDDEKDDSSSKEIDQKEDDELTDIMKNIDDDDVEHGSNKQMIEFSDRNESLEAEKLFLQNLIKDPQENTLFAEKDISMELIVPDTKSFKEKSMLEFASDDDENDKELSDKFFEKEDNEMELDNSSHTPIPEEIIEEEPRRKLKITLKKSIEKDDSKIHDALLEKMIIRVDNDQHLLNNNKILSQLPVKREAIQINLIDDDDQYIKPEKKTKKEKNKSSSSRKSSSKHKKKSSKKRKRSNSLEVVSPIQKKTKRNHVSNSHRVKPLKQIEDMPILIKDQILEKDVVISNRSDIIKFLEFVLNHVQQTNLESFHLTDVIGFHQILILNTLNREFRDSFALDWINIQKTMDILNKRKFTEVKNKQLGKDRVKINDFIDSTDKLIRKSLNQELKESKETDVDNHVICSDLKDDKLKQDVFIDNLVKFHKNRVMIEWEMKCCMVTIQSNDEIEEKRKVAEKNLNQIKDYESIINKRKETDKDMKILGEKQAIILNQSLKRSIIKFNDQQKKNDNRNNLSKEKRHMAMKCLHVIWFFVIK